MREIKFRIWDVKNKNMITFEDEESDNLLMCPFTGALYDHSSLLYRREFKRMQFTGLKDKNGKEIYESDIVKSEWQHDGHINRDHTFSGQVTFGGNDGEPAFYMFSTDGDYYMPFVSYDREELISIEVIGNIYENPELLKGQ